MVELKKRKSKNEIIELFGQYGFDILSNLDDYKNNQSKLIIRCENGHTRETNLQLFRIAKVKCPECEGKIILTIDNIRNEFDKKGYILLETKYVNAHTKMKYICKNHPDNIKEINWNNFSIGKGCRECATESNAKKKRILFSTVQKEFNKKNYSLASEEYKSVHDYLDYICNIHKDLGIQHVTYSNLKITIHNCQSCKEEHVRRGENHPFWNGGIGTLSDYLRTKLDTWKQESMFASNYRCVVTGDYFDVIHHLYSFNKIVSETLSELEYEVYNDISKYTSEELYQMQIKCIELHYKYGLGVCLSNEIHDLFHREYGKYHNVPEQFEDFKQRYLNGEFNNQLKEAVKSASFSM